MADNLAHPALHGALLEGCCFLYCKAVLLKRRNFANLAKLNGLGPKCDVLEPKGATPGCHTLRVYIKQEAKGATCMVGFNVLKI